MSANGIRPGPPGSAPCPQGSRRVPRPPGAPQLEASDSGSYTVAYQAGITRAARPFGNRPLRCIRRPVRFSRKFHHDHVDLGIARWHGDDRVERHRFQLHRGRDDQPALPGVVSRRGLMAHGHECVVRRDIKHQQRNLLQDYRPVVFPRAMPLDDTPSPARGGMLKYPVPEIQSGARPGDTGKAMSFTGPFATAGPTLYSSRRQDGGGV